jgi:hypothetical protein
MQRDIADGSARPPFAPELSYTISGSVWVFFCANRVSQVVAGAGVVFIYR